MCGGGQKGELKREGSGPQCLNSNAKHGTRPRPEMFGRRPEAPPLLASLSRPGETHGHEDKFWNLWPMPRYPCESHGYWYPIATQNTGPGLVNPDSAHLCGVAEMRLKRKLMEKIN